MTELLAVVSDEVMGQVLEQTARGGSLSFRYEAGWLARPDAHPLSVSMPSAAKLHAHRTVRNFLANLFPESPAVLEAWERDYRVSRANPYRLLQHVAWIARAGHSSSGPSAWPSTPS